MQTVQSDCQLQKKHGTALSKQDRLITGNSKGMDDWLLPQRGVGSREVQTFNKLQWHFNAHLGLVNEDRPQMCIEGTH